MKMTKPTEEDFDIVGAFFNACENSLERQKYSLGNPEEQWKEWEDDDEDKIAILKLRKYISHNEEIEEDAIDNRVLMFEYLKQKFAPAGARWRRVYHGASVCIDNACDPTERTLEFLPGIDIKHVANEQ